MWLVPWLACHPPPPPLPAAAPPLLPDGCERPAILTAVTPPEAALPCLEPWVDGCTADGVVTVRNCSPASVHLTPLHSPSLSWGESPLDLAPGAIARVEIRAQEEGAHPIEWIVRVAPGVSLDPAAPLAWTVTNPIRDAAVAACAACNGDWGPQGMLQRLGCLCRTTDGGRPCRWDRECEGACIRVDPAAPFLCAPFVTTFGCYDHRPDGAKAGETYRVCAD